MILYLIFPMENKVISKQIMSIILIFASIIYFVQCQNNSDFVSEEDNASSRQEGNGSNFELPGLQKFDKVRVNERNYEKVRNMHVNWYAAGIKALIGKMGKDLFVKLSKDEQQSLANCLDQIEDKKDLVLSANCLVNIRQEYLQRINAQYLEKRQLKVENNKVNSTEKGDGIPSGENAKNDEEQKILKRNFKMKKLLRKRAATFQSHSTLFSQNSTLERAILVHRRRRKRIIGESRTQQQKEGGELTEWAKRLERFWRDGRRKGGSKSHETRDEKEEASINDSKGMGMGRDSMRRKSKWAIPREEGIKPKFEIKQAKSLEKLPTQQDRSAIIRVSNLISKLAGKDGNDSTTGGATWTRMYESLVRLKRANEKRKESPGARVYDMRMYDLVLGRDEPTMGPKEKMSPQGLLQMGLSLLDNLRNETVQRNSNFKFMSPRFAPLMPDKQDAHKSKSILSPTIFALYEPDEEKGNSRNKPAKKDGQGLDIASMSNVLKATGLNGKDRDALLQSLMEVSGSIGHVQEAMDLLKALNFFEIEPDIMDANERVLNAYTRMEGTFEREQQSEIEHEGWTFLRERQFDQLCHDQNADFPNDVKMEISHFGQLDRERREQAIWKRIERIARNIPDEIGDKLDKRKQERLFRWHLDKRQRRRRQTATNGTIQWLSVLKPVVLEPYMFTPVYGLSVLGPLILSPNIFSPLILAPSVLGPYVLSPAAPIPFILSPYVFGPFILSPMALAPFILNPYVLSPNVLNPFALSPLILSPTVLSPDILSPQVLGGGILSPTVGSPAILTESAMMASVLSPSVLS